ncbi:EAL domain-containing response regulator [Vibrio jasicida]|uniref:EAL domain-containing response regulator n=1 Tax=Vibrio jasicida TaxID=766224 RepID=UPI004067E817
MTKSVLIVDDIELSREVLKNAVSSASDSIKVTTAENAFDAMNKMHARSFEIVIMDIMMPNGNGFELLNMMSQYDVDSRVIIMSALDKAIIDSVKMISRLYEVEIFMALEKPIVSGDITQIMKDELKGVVKSKPSTLEDIDDFRIALCYQPQMLSSTASILGINVLPQWSEVVGSRLLSNYFLPNIEVLKRKKAYTEIVVEKFYDDYINYYAKVDSNLFFVLDIDINNLIESEFALNKLSKLSSINSQHAFNVVVSKNDVFRMMRDDAFTKVRETLNINFTLSLSSFESNMLNTICFDEFDLDEIRFNKEAANTITTSELCEVLDIFERIKEIKKNKDVRISFEGIDDKKAAQTLERMGCHYQQGVYYGVPVTGEVMKDILNNQILLISKQD